MSVLLIAIGGGIGTALRYGVTVGLATALGAAFPYGTLAANTLGSLLLGFVAEAFGGATIFGTDVRLVVGVGVLGGFTTYSSFNLETLRMFQQGEPARALAYLTGTVLACALAGLAGLTLAGRLASAAS